jgi:hypothetical protein
LDKTSTFLTSTRGADIDSGERIVGDLFGRMKAATDEDEEEDVAATGEEEEEEEEPRWLGHQSVYRPPDNTSKYRLLTRYLTSSSFVSFSFTLWK